MKTKQQKVIAIFAIPLMVSMIFLCTFLGRDLISKSRNADAPAPGRNVDPLSTGEKVLPAADNGEVPPLPPADEDTQVALPDGANALTPQLEICLLQKNAETGELSPFPVDGIYMLPESGGGGGSYNLGGRSKLRLAVGSIYKSPVEIGEDAIWRINSYNSPGYIQAEPVVFRVPKAEKGKVQRVQVVLEPKKPSIRPVRKSITVDCQPLLNDLVGSKNKRIMVEYKSTKDKIYREVPDNGKVQISAEALGGELRVLAPGKLRVNSACYIRRVEKLLVQVPEDADWRPTPPFEENVDLSSAIDINSSVFADKTNWKLLELTTDKNASLAVAFLPVSWSTAKDGTKKSKLEFLRDPMIYLLPGKYWVKLRTERKEACVGILDYTKVNGKQYLKFTQE